MISHSPERWNARPGRNEVDVAPWHPPESDLFSPVEAAGRLRSNPRTLERWRTNGTGPNFVRIGRRIFYRRAALESWLEKRTRSHTGQGEDE